MNKHCECTKMSFKDFLNWIKENGVTTVIFEYEPNQWLVYDSFIDDDKAKKAKNKLIKDGYKAKAIWGYLNIT